MAITTAFRVSNWDTPFRPGPARRHYRFSDETSDATQYWALHPLGPLAETIRWRNIRTPAFIEELRVRTWAAAFDVDGFQVVTFATAAAAGIAPEALVDDDYGNCQQWAEVIRRSVPGVIVPSAALPGTYNLVVFGPRVRIPYGMTSVDLGMVTIPSDPTADVAGPPADLLRHVRWRGHPHVGLESWSNGVDLPPPRVLVPQS